MRGLFRAFSSVDQTDTADEKNMATTLELARKIRDRIVNHSTGRLNITFADSLAAVDFSEGTIVTPPLALLQCLKEPPVRFDFLPMDIPEADELQSGAALLVEALDSIDDEALLEVWEAYRDWTILLIQDPDIHRTKVSDHLDESAGRLRQLLKPAVTGAVSLEPPVKRSIQDEMDFIRAATARDKYWEALSVDRTAGRDEIKHAYRELARQFHPDRWHSAKNDTMKGRIEQAFRDIQCCYENALKAVPRRLAAVPPITPEPVRTESNRVATIKPAHTPEYKQPQAPTEEPQPSHSVVTSYGEVGQATDQTPDSLFRSIFDKFFRAA